MIIKKLPHWVVTNKYPGFYDTDSGTTIEQTARVYKKMNELVEDYNKFVDETNKAIDEFVTGMTGTYEEFTVAMEQKFNDFVKVIELKVDSQDQVIADAVAYMKTNLVSTTHDLLLEMFETNELTLDFEYNTETESLDIKGVVVEGRGE